MRWGHGSGLGDTKNTYEIAAGEPVEKKPGRRRGSSIKVHLIYMGYYGVNLSSGLRQRSEACICSNMGRYQDYMSTDDE
jgi:hypothetical protein